MKAKTKIVRARVKLLLDQPFFGTLTTYLIPEEDTTTPTVATDCRYLYYNPSFIESLEDSEVEFVLCHEVLHCAFQHFIRQGHRNKSKWNIATDYAVNGILVDSKFAKMPEGGLFNRKFRGMYAEQIYSLLPDNVQGRTLDVHIYIDSGGGSTLIGDEDSGSSDNVDVSVGIGADLKSESQDDNSCSDPSPERAKSRKEEQSIKDVSSRINEIKRMWRIAVATSIDVAKQRGDVPAEVDRLVNHILYPKIKWSDILRRFIEHTCVVDYQWIPPNSKYIGDDIILPSVCREKITVIIAVDTSGSISNAELNDFINEVTGILSVKTVEAYLLSCDAKVNHVQYFPMGTLVSFQDIKVKGGGGTDFNPVFRWVEENGVRPNVLIYLTDGYGLYPPEPPCYPVVWVVSGRYDNFPFGEVIRLEVEE